MDKDYWDKYYSDHFIDEASPFAKFCQTEYFSQTRSIVELGCGSGRDLKYFRTRGHEITGVDQSATAIAKLKCEVDRHVSLIEGDFTSLGVIAGADCVYSRWTLHSVTETEASRAFSWAADLLPRGGLLCIEARSVRDAMYGEGTEIGKDEFKTNHYRRFLRIDELTQELGEFNFDIVFELEASGLSVYKGDDPTLIRIIAER
jgi:tellurite methyltransferase